MKILMKVLYWIAWISTVVGAFFIVLGMIAIRFPFEQFLGAGLREIINLFHAANSFLLLALVLFVATRQFLSKTE